MIKVSGGINLQTFNSSDAVLFLSKMSYSLVAVIGNGDLLKYIQALPRFILRSVRRAFETFSVANDNKGLTKCASPRWFAAFDI